MAGSTTESLRNIELVKSLGLAQQEIGRLAATTEKILQLELKKVRFIRSLSFVQGTTVNLLRTSIMFLMLYLIFTRAITVGQFFSLFLYSFFIFGPLQELGNIINVYREAEVSLKNFQDILQTPREPRPLAPAPLSGLQRLAFENVTFKHQSASSPAISDISFEVRRGDTVAFVGPSGSGKSTLVKLLVGLYRPQSGDILISGGDNWTGSGTTNTGNNNSNVFSSNGNTLTRSAVNMNRARWYSSSTVLVNGDIYIQGGSGGADFPEVRQQNGSLRLLSAAGTRGYA